MQSNPQAYNLVEEIKSPQTSKHGLRGKMIDQFANVFTKLLKSSISHLLTIQQNFNKEIQTDVENLRKQDQASDFNYSNFEKQHYVNEKVIREKQSKYAAYFKAGEKVIDIGCGFGFFLELLKEKEVNGIGVEFDMPSLEACKRKGLEAIQGMAPGILDQWEDGTVDGITAFQVVEHMRNNDLMGFLKKSARKVKSGGHIIIETPNPEMLGIYAYSYSKDITHIRPVHPETLKFILEDCGMEIVETVYSSPIGNDRKLEHIDGNDTYNRNIDKLNQLLFGNLDYAIVARKR